MNKSNLSFGKCMVAFLTGIVLISSCKKDKMPAIDPLPSSTTGVYVLCEGAFGKLNNSSITYYDAATSKSDKDYFKKQNGIDLGSNASDLKQYGSKMYCVITGTAPAVKDSYLEVINIATGKSIKRIPMFDATAGFLPRYIVFNKSKAYVSGYDGSITKIDTASLNIEARVKVGGALEAMAIVNNKIYVTNSNHSDYGTDNNSSVSVVDLNTFTKIKDIPVDFNPTRIAAANTGDLFVITAGDFGNIDLKPSLDKVSSITDMKTQSTVVNLTSIVIAGNKGFVIEQGAVYPDPSSLKLLNVSAGTIGTDFITDGTVVSDYYGVTVNTLNNDDVYVADANGYAEEGKVFCFDSTGKKKFEFTTGSIPQSVVFNYSYK